MQASRVDLVCCVRVDACDDEGDERQSLLRSPDERPAFNPSPSYAGMPVSTTKSNPRIGTPTPRKAETSTQHANGEGFLYRFVRDYYSPFILHPIIKPIVVCSIRSTELTATLTSNSFSINTHPSNVLYLYNSQISVR